MIYNEISYWNKIRKWPNTNNSKKHVKINNEQLINFVKEKLNGCKNIIDFGPGIGRLFPAYENIENVEGFDISDKWKDIIIKESEKYNFNFNHNVIKSIGKLPYPDKTFDACVCISVLFHQRPQYIDLIMNELARISKFVIANGSISNNIDIVENKKHFYNYDYKLLCENNNLEMFDVEFLNSKDIYFCFKEKENKNEVN